MAWKLLAHLLDFDPSQTKVSIMSFSFWKNAVKSLGGHFFKGKTNIDVEKDRVDLADSAVNL